MTELITSKDLRFAFGPARDQGQRPTCLAFAASDAHAAARTGWIPLSCEFVFFHAQRRAGRKSSMGALLSIMLEALKDDGQPEELGWPYINSTPIDEASWKPPSNVGPRFGRVSEQQSATIDAVISELNNDRPSIMLLQLSRSFYAPTSAGIIKPGANELPDPMRRHAVVAAGHGKFNDERAVLVRNSWGLRWGLSGYGWLTESFIEPRLYAMALLKEAVDVSTDSNPA